MYVRHSALVLMVSVFLAATSVGLADAPANDSFTNRIVLSGSSITFTGTLAGATIENGESLSACSTTMSGGSVWWTWTAPGSTPVVITILRNYSTFDGLNTWLQVCAGTNLAELSEIDCNRFDGPVGRYVKFVATEGTSYQFRVVGGWAGGF